MHPHPHPHHDAIWPGVSGQRPLCSHRRRHRLARLAERDEMAVAFSADLAAVEPGERRPQQPLVLGQDLDVPVTQPLEQPRRTLDVAEQQRDGSSRHLSHDIPVPKRSRPVTSIVRLWVEFLQVRGPGSLDPTGQAPPIRTFKVVYWDGMCSATAVRLAASVLRMSADN